MEEEKQQFRDKSGDKKYFTITPNMIINGYSAMESGAYTYAKKRAGEENRFFESAKNTAQNLKISKPTWLKIREKFVKNEVFKFIGWKEGKTHPVKVFEVVDIWGKNLGIYKKKGKNKNLSLREKGKKENFSKVKNTTTNNNPLEKEPIKKDIIIKNFKNGERRVIPVGDPPKINKKKLERYHGMRDGIIKKFSIPPQIRTPAQEEAAKEERSLKK